MKLIVGLGNIGTNYSLTRHNIGFMAVDKLIEKYNIDMSRHKFSGNYGEFLYNSCLTDICVDNNKIKSIEINHDTWIDTDVLILAIGHSARDTYAYLMEKGMAIEPKAFSVGVRVEHLQSDINEAMYGKYAEDKMQSMQEFQNK